MKRLIIMIFCISFAFCGCSESGSVESSLPDFESTAVQSKKAYVKSVWLTYYELDSMAAGKSESEFYGNVKDAFEKVGNMGFNTVTVQVRAFADAAYDSKYFKNEYAFDALKIMCDIAKGLDLRLEAWVNPYRISYKKNEKVDFKNSMIYRCKSGTYFNPADREVTRLIKNGVVEIVKNYDVSAIHFDDYFYPTTSKNIDKYEYKSYKKRGGTKDLASWRRDNINDMVKTVYKAIKKTNSDVLFGISPGGNIKNDYSTLYADVEKWAKGGWCDYVCPQVYFGFKNVYQPFMFTVKKWIGITDCDLYVGLPLYKAGRIDKYAASEDDDAINEFKNNDDIIFRQITYLSKLEEVSGYYVFSYGCLDDERCKKEVENMLKVLQ